jgi:hypothetical protein
MLGFDDPNALSARVQRYTGWRPMALRRHTSTAAIIQQLAKEIRASDESGR